jgi:RNA polymerase subunit RPABC4/transcription elongation factor Spt4
MKCPNCSRPIPDGSFDCPYCHEPLNRTQRIDLGELRWCSVCGALMAPDAQSCPKCGTPAPVSSVAAVLRANKEAEEKAETKVADLQSAIPPTGPDVMTPTAASDVMPRVRQLVVAACAAVAIVGGAALLITHPWDPDANNISAKTPYDTSNAGNPETVKTLESQDGTSSKDAAASTDPIFDALSSAYEKLGDYAKRLDESEAALKTTGVSGTADERSAGLSTAKALSLEVSNTISSIDQTSDGAGAYSETISNLDKLGNWLRNRCDGLTSAWSASVSSDDPSAESDSILSGISANPTYKKLFDDSYASCKPVSAVSE